MGSSLLQCRRWQGQQMQIVESSIHGSQTFWCLFITFNHKMSKIGKIQQQQCRKKTKEWRFSNFDTRADSDNFQALLLLCFHVQLTVWYRA